MLFWLVNSAEHKNFLFMEYIPYLQDVWLYKSAESQFRIQLTEKTIYIGDNHFENWRDSVTWKLEIKIFFKFSQKFQFFESFSVSVFKLF